MDSHRFDGLSKYVGRRLSRRSALRGIGAGGAAAALMSDVVTRHALAEDGTPAAIDADTQLCVIPFEATVRSGPNEGLTLEGFLGLGIRPDGSVENGALAQPEGETLSVVGQVNGRAVNLMITVADGRYAFGVGTSELDFREACRAGVESGMYSAVGQMGGPFVGPQTGDSGDWLVCCCPSDANNYDCGELPACGRCRPPVGGGPSPDPDCVIACYQAGGGTQACQHACLQG